MDIKLKTVVIILFYFILTHKSNAQEIFEMPEGIETRWFSFENQTGEKGKGGQENRGAKGHPSDRIPAGETITLMEVNGTGTVRRIWMTISDRSPQMLRSLRLDMYWDGEDIPAVTAPLGDFFGIGLGRKAAFESIFFSDPEGRSFNCIIPMPFKKGAKITITNESNKRLDAIFYDIDITKGDNHSDNTLYFHAFWNRDTSTILGDDYELLPKIKGRGRFLGVNIGLKTHQDYDNTWWGEGEVKMYIDGDSELPTLVGTGTEDYVGTAYGQGVFDHHYQGSPIINNEKKEYAFYRYHVPDPVFFYRDIKITIQQMGGAPVKKFLSMQEEGARMVPVTLSNPKAMLKLLEEEINLENQKGWTNFYRSDDISSTAYFYLDQPGGRFDSLPILPIRTKQ